jgi:hypothetical protein
VKYAIGWALVILHFMLFFCLKDMFCSTTLTVLSNKKNNIFFLQQISINMNTSQISAKQTVGSLYADLVPGPIPRLLSSTSHNVVAAANFVWW